MANKSVILLVAATFFMAVLGEAAPAADQARPIKAAGDGCPTRFSGAPDLGSGLPQAVNAVPRLVGLLICEYEERSPTGKPRKPGRPTEVIAHRRIGDRRHVKKLAASLNRLRPFPQFRGPPICPEEVKGPVYLRFSYENGHQLSVKLIRSGCSGVVAGRHGRRLILTNSIENRISVLLSG